MNVPDLNVEGEILKANSRFYEAINDSDLEAMEEIWSHGPEVRCIHPGWDVLTGWQIICDSWEAIFTSSPGLVVRSHAVEVCIIGDMAWVQCLEEISSRPESQSDSEPGSEPEVEPEADPEPEPEPDPEPEGGPDADDESEAAEGQVSFARTTNLYRKTPGGWRMILHHASPIPGEPQEPEFGSVH
jgi:ketosteroid isomerase-like protein